MNRLVLYAGTGEPRYASDDRQAAKSYPPAATDLEEGVRLFHDPKASEVRGKVWLDHPDSMEQLIAVYDAEASDPGEQLAEFRHRLGTELADDSSFSLLVDREPVVDGVGGSHRPVAPEWDPGETDLTPSKVLDAKGELDLGAPSAGDALGLLAWARGTLGDGVSVSVGTTARPDSVDAEVHVHVGGQYERPTVTGATERYLNDNRLSRAVEALEDTVDAFADGDERRSAAMASSLLDASFVEQFGLRPVPGDEGVTDLAGTPFVVWATIACAVFTPVALYWRGADVIVGLLLQAVTVPPAWLPAPGVSVAVTRPAWEWVVPSLLVLVLVVVSTASLPNLTLSDRLPSTARFDAEETRDEWANDVCDRVSTVRNWLPDDERLAEEIEPIMRAHGVVVRDASGYRKRRRNYRIGGGALGVLLGGIVAVAIATLVSAIVAALTGVMATVVTLLLIATALAVLLRVRRYVRNAVGYAASALSLVLEVPKSILSEVDPGRSKVPVDSEAGSIGQLERQVEEAPETAVEYADTYKRWFDTAEGEQRERIAAALWELEGVVPSNVLTDDGRRSKVEAASNANDSQQTDTVETADEPTVGTGAADSTDAPFDEESESGGKVKQFVEPKLEDARADRERDIGGAGTGDTGANASPETNAGGGVGSSMNRSSTGTGSSGGTGDADDRPTEAEPPESTGVDQPTGADTAGPTTDATPEGGETGDDTVVDSSLDVGGSDTTTEFSTYRHDAQHSGYHPSTRSITDATVRWHVSVDGADGQYTGPVVANDSVLVGTTSGTVVSLNEFTGEVEWRQNGPAPMAGTPAVSGESVYALHRDGTIRCLDLNNGTVQWKSVLEQTVPLSNSPTVANGTVYAISTHDDGTLYGIDVTDGEERTVVQPVSETTGTPTVVGRKVITAGTVITAFGADDGDEWGPFDSSGGHEWVYPANEFAGKIHPGTVAVQEGVCYAATTEGELFAVDGEHGNRIATTDLPSGVTEPLAVTEEHVYAVAGERTLTKYPQSLEASAWELETKGRVTSAPVAVDDGIYLVEDKKRIRGYLEKQTEPLVKRLQHPGSSRGKQPLPIEAPLAVTDRGLFVKTGAGTVAKLTPAE